jgi:hypothetical protein
MLHVAYLGQIMAHFGLEHELLSVEGEIPMGILSNGEKQYPGCTC